MVRSLLFSTPTVQDSPPLTRRSRIRRVSRLLPFVAMSLAATPLRGQVIRGTLTDLSRGAPIANAEVALLDSAGLRLLALSVDAEGGFEIDLHAPGTYRVVASALGYSTATTPILSVAAGEIRELRIALPPLPFAVDSLRLVIPSPTRAQAAPARVGRLDASELAELLPQTSLLTLLRHLNMPSITVTEMYEPGSSFYMPCIQFVRSISPSNRGCRMVKIVLNGQGVPDAASFLQSFDPSLLIKVEFIPPALAGARWGVGSQNGVLLLEER